MAGLQMLQKKIIVDFKKSRQWKQVGLFLITHRVLFDLGCINVLKNLKCLDKLKSDNIPSMAKCLLSPLGRACCPWPGAASHIPASPFPTWNPSSQPRPQQMLGTKRSGAGIELLSQVSSARGWQGTAHSRDLALQDPHSSILELHGAGSSGTNPTDGEPWASPGPRAESFCVGDEATARNTSSKKHQVHFYYSLHLCPGSFCRGAKPWWGNIPACGFSKRNREESRVPWVRKRGCGAMQPLCQAAGNRGCEVCQEWSRGGGRHTAEANQDFHGGHTR